MTDKNNQDKVIESYKEILISHFLETIKIQEKVVYDSNFISIENPKGEYKLYFDPYKQEWTTEKNAKKGVIFNEFNNNFINMKS